MFRNLQPVTKNLVLLNIVVYIVCLIFTSRGIDLTNYLGAHYITSPLFEPYQIVTHFFMHSLSNPLHIFMNMFMLVTFGSILERVWGAKRFFFAYIISAIGAYLIYSLIGSFEIYEMGKQITSMGVELQDLNGFIVSHPNVFPSIPPDSVIFQYIGMSNVSMVGASGAVFGIMAAFAYLFPNTEMFLMFIPFPIKAKYLIGGYFLIELYLSIQSIQGIYADSVAHLAHVGGAVFGFVLTLIWNRKDRNNFY